MEQDLKRRRLQKAPQQPLSDQCIAVLRTAGARLERLYEGLERMEEETASSLQSAADNEVRQKIKDMRLRMEAAIRNELVELCGSRCEPVEIARGMGCCVLQATSAHGRDVDSHNSDYHLQNHIDMVSDKVRVLAFQSAISRCAQGRTVLDVGTGAFCLLARMALAAGASQVDAVEVNPKAVAHAARLLHYEVARKSPTPAQDLHADEELATTAQLLPDLPSLGDPEAHLSDDAPGFSREPPRASQGPHIPCYTLSVKRGSGASRLCLYSGSLESVRLSGPYHLVVHELLGHIASSEGVAETLQALRHRGLCAQHCTFIPCSAGTLFAPTSKLELASPLERVLHCFFNANTKIQVGTKYHARCFDASRLMAKPRFFEFLEFSEEGGLEKASGRKRIVFITDKDGEFDGLHFHLHIQVDARTEIDTLSTETTWSTTYVRLLERAVWLPEGSRIVCDCETRSACGMPRYSVDVSIGEPWDERRVATFCWEGAT